MANTISTTRKRRGYIAPVLLTFLIWTFVSADAVQAQDWGFDPILRIAGTYDDNANLSIFTDQEVVLEGYLFEASAVIDYSSPLTTFSITPRILSRKYEDNPDLESDDQFLRSAFRHTMNSSSIGFRLNYDRQSVRTGERSDTDLDVEDPDEIAGDETGATIRGRRTKLRFKPIWNYNFSSKSTISVDVDYREVDYEDVFLDLLKDFQDVRLNLSYRRALSNVNTAVITTTGRRFETVDGLSEFTGYAVQGGFRRSLSEKTELRAMVGLETSERVDAEEDTNVIGNITLIRRLETIRMLAEYRRAVTGTGTGRLSIRNSLNLNFTRQLNDRIAVGLGARAYQSGELNDAVGANDRDYVELHSRFIWYLSRPFSLQFNYRYTMLNRENLGERANSNQVDIWFVYRPNRIPKLR